MATKTRKIKARDYIADGKSLRGAISMTVAKIIREKLQARRVETGMTYGELALRTSTSRQAIESAFNGSGKRMGMGVGSIYLYALALGMKPGDLLPTEEELKDKGLGIEQVSIWKLDL